jgi:stage V sporulation protein D (sporulation-specific penicillin-binding protein)
VIGMSVKKTYKRNINKGRLFFIFSILFVIYIALITRLYYIMVVKGKDYRTLAVNQWTDNIEISPIRGRVLDKNDQELAISSEVYRIDVDLEVLIATAEKKKKSMDSIAQDLSKILNMNLKDISAKLASTNSSGKPLRFVSLKRKVEKDTADAIKALNLSGFIISQDTKRYYPNINFLSHVLGHTNMEGDGVTGIELTYNKFLKGIPGSKIVERDRHNNDLPYVEEVLTAAVNGKDIKLTIDEKIQEIAETTADEALKINKAKSVSITVMNPKNGEILAIVNKPDYDPNNPSKGITAEKQMQETWKNRALSDVFEPGSIFKAITAAAALQNNIVSESDKFKCEGSIKVGNRTFYCDQGKAHGTQNISDIIKNSCNVGFIQLGQKIGKDKLVEFAQQMGFGNITGVDLPGESPGILKDSKDVSIVDLATMSYGHGLAVTQLQYLAALNVIANGGTWIRPHIMQEIYHTEDNEKKIDKQFDNFGKKTVMNKEDAEVLRSYLERVVKEGTATATYIEDYHIAGKTGTAMKVNTETGGYEPQKYVSSFAGMAPASDPVVTVIITIDEPDPLKYYAGETAVPAAKELFQKLFNIMPLK